MANIPSQTKPVFQTADVPAGPTVTPASEIPKPKTIIKENQMAEVDTITLSREHADIRREGAEHTSEIRYDIGQGTNEGVKETLKAAWAAVDATKDARYDILSATGNHTDRIVESLTYEEPQP